MTKNILTEENKDIVKAMAEKRASGDMFMQDEFYQEGCIALIRAAKSYDSSRGVPFWGYASYVVKHAMSKALSDISQIVSNSLEPEDSAVLYEDEVVLFQVEDCSQPTPYKMCEMSDSQNAVRHLVSQLPYKERVAITLFYGLDGLYERPLESIGDELGCSVEGARKICARGVERLRGWLAKPQYNLWAA